MHYPRSSRYTYRPEIGRKESAVGKEWLFNYVQSCLPSSRSANLLILFLVGTMFVWLLLITRPVGLLSSTWVRLIAQTFLKISDLFSLYNVFVFEF